VLPGVLGRLPLRIGPGIEPGMFFLPIALGKGRDTRWPEHRPRADALIDLGGHPLQDLAQLGRAGAAHQGIEYFG